MSVHERASDASGEPIDWDACSTAVFEVRQHYRYEYPGPIEDLHQALILVPPDRLDGQRLLFHEVTAAPEARVRYHVDQFGNRICTLLLPRVEQSLEFSVRLRVQRSPTAGEPQRSERQSGLFLLPSPLTEPTELLRTAAADLLVFSLPSSSSPLAGEGPGERSNDPSMLAERINAWVHERLEYRPGVTSFQTPAGEALRIGAGVCQDFAHVMIALCRLAGLPARYVSGHVLGEGAMHAWVQVLLPSRDPRDPWLRWRPFDPTHGGAATLPYVTIAVGRDFEDVSPTRGTFRAPYAGRLAGSEQRASLLSVT